MNLALLQLKRYLQSYLKSNRTEKSKILHKRMCRVIEDYKTAIYIIEDNLKLKQ